MSFPLKCSTYDRFSDNECSDCGKDLIDHYLLSHAPYKENVQLGKRSDRNLKANCWEYFDTSFIFTLEMGVGTNSALTWGCLVECLAAL